MTQPPASIFTFEHDSSGVLPCAVGPGQSRGRVHDDPLGHGLAGFALDRHRVTSSTSFRRLQHKTQVFVTHEHDHFRTRLTHTLEVAAIAQRLASGLRVSAALAECIALCHDLGHAPFGHAGEATLRDLMADDGGFEHNTHSLRIVDYLEHPFPPFRGLNLTFEVREGLIKHATAYDRPEPVRSDPAVWDLLESGPLPTLEAQVASIADRLAYDTHDLEDALGAGLVSEDDLAEIELWQTAAASIRNDYPDAQIFAVRRPILDHMLELLLTDVMVQTQVRLATAGFESADAVRHHTQPVVTFSENMLPAVNQLEAFLAERVYRHHRLVRMDTKARRFIERLFDAYVERPDMLPQRYAARLDEQGDKRVVCDYIAGMTDRYCQDEYKRLFEPFERV
ncbi:MAG TPA: deoxyguanosinetriphosphate triphosphohydrolase [Phycisphaerae bacterium]|jgi:dGTPase